MATFRASKIGGHEAMRRNELDQRVILAARIRATGGTQIEAAEAAGVTPRTVRRWEADADLWSRALAAVGAAGAGVDAEEDNPDGWTYSEAKRRKEAALARLRELELAEKERRLITIEDAIRPIEALLTLVRGRLLALPSRLAGALPGDPATTFDVAERIVHELMQELAEAAEEEGQDDADA